MTSKDGLRDRPKSIDEIKDETLRATLEEQIDLYLDASADASAAQKIKDNLMKGYDDEDGTHHPGIAELVKVPELQMTKKLEAPGWTLTKTPGRARLDQTVLKAELLGLGLGMEDIVAAFEAATSYGDDYYTVRGR